MIDDYLRLFDREGDEYKKLIYDSSRQENEPVVRVNDINKGALHNALEWHRRAALNFSQNMNLRLADGLLISLWAEFWAIERPGGLSDEGFKTYILATALGLSPTTLTISSILSGMAVVREPRNMGPYFNYSYLGIGPSRSGVQSFIPTHTLNVVYIIFETSDYDKSVLDAIGRIVAAGKGVLVGVKEN